MQCENYFCVYEKSSKCLLETIGINTLGMCNECILVNLTEKIELEKENLLNDILNRKLTGKSIT